MSHADSPARPGPSAVIVGAGASGLYTAQLLRRMRPDLAIDVVEALPVPFGLIRYGVAPDHQGTKAVTRQFERLFERENVELLAGVTVGRDVSLDELASLYDKVVVATGLSEGRRLGVPGETLPGVFNAGELTRWINSHPDEPDICPALGQAVVIVGHGNVAIDLVRILAKTPAEFADSDFDPARSAALAHCGVRSIDVVGRGRPELAQFAPEMVRELASLTDVRIEVHWPAGTAHDGDAASLARLDALREVDGKGAADSSRVVRFRFLHVPESVTGMDAVQSLCCRDVGEDRRVELPASSVITAIGFCGTGQPVFEWGRDEKGVLLPHAAGSVHTVGWLHGGGKGTIADSRLDAKRVAERIAQECPREPSDDAAKASSKRATRGLMDLLSQRKVPVVSYAGWKRIQAVEDARREHWRARTKLACRDDMLRIASASLDEGS
jgi:ferredoxin--NADP+ reductase